MTDNVSLSPSTGTHFTQPPVKTPQNTSQGAVQREGKPVTQQPSPANIAVTELASEAASDRRESLNSISQVTEELRDAITTLNSVLEKTKTKAIITRDEEINRFIVRIADEASGEIVREIPSEAILKFSRNLQELKGLIFDESL